MKDRSLDPLQHTSSYFRRTYGEIVPGSTDSPPPPPPPTIIMLQRFLTTQLPVDLGKISWLLPYTSGANRNRVLGRYGLACENIRFSPLFAAGDVSRERSPAAKSEEKRMFSQARYEVRSYRKMLLHSL